MGKGITTSNNYGEELEDKMRNAGKEIIESHIREKN